MIDMYIFYCIKSSQIGSRIDHAGHSNDPVANYHDVLAYNDAMQVVQGRNTIITIDVCTDI